MQLNKVQKSFKDHMFSTVEAVENPEAEFAQLFDVGNIPLDRRLKIYRNHIVTTLSEVLVMSFPLVEILVGEDFLKTAAKLYLFDNPPTEACLDRYGSGFPDFLKGYEHANALPYLADVARLDWLMNEVRCAKDDNTVTINDLAQLPPEQYEETIFKLKNSVQLLHSDFPLAAIYNFCKEKSGDDAQLNIDDEESFILITRMEWDPTVFNLEASEYHFFSQLQEEKPLGECLEQTMEAYPDFNFAEFLQNYMGLETFSAFITK